MPIKVYTLPAWTVLYVGSFRDALKHFTGKKVLTTAGIIHGAAVNKTIDQHPHNIKLLLELSDEDMNMLKHIQDHHIFYKNNQMKAIVQAVFNWLLYNTPKKCLGVQHERTS